MEKVIEKSSCKKAEVIIARSLPSFGSRSDGKGSYFWSSLV